MLSEPDSRPSDIEDQLRADIQRAISKVRQASAEESVLMRTAAGLGIDSPDGNEAGRKAARVHVAALANLRAALTRFDEFWRNSRGNPPTPRPPADPKCR